METLCYPLFLLIDCLEILKPQRKKTFYQSWTNKFKAALVPLVSTESEMDKLKMNHRREQLRL